VADRAVPRAPGGLRPQGHAAALGARQPHGPGNRAFGCRHLSRYPFHLFGGTRQDRPFEIAETELFRAVGLPYSEVFDRLDIWLPRVQIHFDFRKPLMLDDLIEVSAYIGRFGTKSLTLRFEVTKKGEAGLVADGHVVLACVSRSTFQSVPIPPEIKERLKDYVSE